MAAKKWLAGCLVVLLVMGLALGAAWWFVLRPMWSAGGEMVAGAKDWAMSLDLGDEISNDAPFVAPADGRLTPAQVDALVRVQSVVVREMGSDLAALGQRAQAAQASRGQGAPSLQDMATLYREASGLMSKLRAAQAKGVNQTGLSRQEYAFIRKQALAALPLLVDVGRLPAIPGVPGLDVAVSTDEADMAAARHNADLLRPHLSLLEKTLGAGLLLSAPGK